MMNMRHRAAGTRQRAAADDGANPLANPALPTAEEREALPA